MHRIVQGFLAVGLAIAVLSVTGCGRRGASSPAVRAPSEGATGPGAAKQAAKPSASSAPTSSASSSAPVTVHMWVIWNTQPRKAALADIVAAFERENPDIHIAVSTYEPDAYKTAIRVGVGSAEPPDIYFVWDGEWLHNFVRAGAVLDLTSRMDADRDAWRSVFLPTGLKRFTYRDRVWGVPYLLQCTFFLYNKSIFRRLGLSIPKTWPQLLDTVDALNKAGLVPIALGNQERWPAHHFPGVLWQRLMGEEAVEAQYDPLGPGKYDNPDWMKGLDLFSQLLKRKAFNKAPNATTRDSARTLFYAGRAAMFYTGTWDFGQLSKGGQAPQSFWDAWDFFNFPSVPGGKGDQTALAGAPDGYVVCSKSKHPDAAVTFLKYMTRPEVARGFVSKCQELVQVRGAVTAQNAGPHLRKYAAMVQAAKHICPWPDTLMERSVADELLNRLQSFLDGRTTAAQVLQAVRQSQAQAKKRLVAEEAAAKKKAAAG